MYCFSPDSFDFFVAPQAPELDLDIFNLVLYLIVFDAHSCPVLIADVRDDSWGNRADLDLHYRADYQICCWFNFMYQDCPLPCFWGLSLLGTSLCVHSDFATRSIELHFIDCPSPGHALPHDFLGDDWNIDILSEEGLTKMRQVVQDILTNAEVLERV